MPPTVIIRDNPTSGSVPLAADVGVAELVINTTDGYLYTKNVVGNVIRLNRRTGNPESAVSASYATTASYALNGGGGAGDFNTLANTPVGLVSSSLQTLAYIRGQTVAPAIVSASSAVTASSLLIGTNGQGKLYNSNTDIVIEASGNLNLASSNGNTPLRLFSSASTGIGTVAPFNFNVLTSARAYVGFFADWDSTYRARGSNAGILEFSSGSFVLSSATGLTPLNTFVPTPLLVISASGLIAASAFSASNGVEINRVDAAGIASANYITLRAAYGANAALSHSIIWRDATSVTGKIDTRFNGTTVDMFLGSLYNSGYNNVDIVTIKGTGRVGVGTIAPGAILHVQGNISASSYTSSIAGNIGFMGTASYAAAALSASYAQVFPYTGSAIISGSTRVTGTLEVSDTIISRATLATVQVQSATITGNFRTTGTDVRIGTITNHDFGFFQNSAIAWYIDTNKYFLPNVNNTYDVGATAQRVRTVWTNAISSSQPIASASYALTSSYALNGGGGAAFPYVGDAVITGSLYVSGTVGSVTAVTFNSLSDRNQKTDIVNINDALTIIDSLNGVRFMWKSSHLPSAGLIAQDVEAILPELVTSHNEGKVLNYNGVIGVLVEAVKQLSRRVEELERDRL